MIKRTAIVTGNAKRTGKAISIALAKEGYDVIVHYNTSKKEAVSTEKELRSIGSDSFCIKADISTAGGATKLVEAAIRKKGRIDVLINNVGNFLVKTIDKVTPEEWEYLLRTTATTTFNMCHYALPYMVKQNFGRIVNISDSGADLIKAWPRITPYMAGKTSVLILTKSLAEAYAKYDITVNAVSPGVLENSIVKPEEKIPKGRDASYSDITNAILFLIRKESEYITGSNIKVSGGWNV